ncbi:MAG: Ig-like domain-containing protein [Chitinophagaceae bacterium]
MHKIFSLLLVSLPFATALSQNCGSTNIALTKPAAASGSLDQFSLPGNAVDNNSNTNWKSTNSPVQWFRVDLQQPYVICGIRLTWANQFYFPTSYNVYVSNDVAAGSGTLVYSTTAGDGDIDAINLSSPVSGQYIRVETSVRSASWADHYELVEFEVYPGTGNAVPTVSISQPSGGQSFTAGTAITIQANASDNGEITKVEFFEGNTKLGEDTEFPYSFLWPNPAAGIYSLTAKATDDDNATSTSAAVTITVNAPPAGSGWSVTGNEGTNANTNFIGTKDNTPLVIKTFNNERMRVLPDGKVLFNTVTPKGMVTINGDVWAKKLNITQQNWPDYVFHKTYRLRSIAELEKYIRQNRHLPDVPSAEEVAKNGISVGDNQAVLLRKIEELTLYLIQQNKRIEQQQAEIEKLKKRADKTN